MLREVCSLGEVLNSRGNFDTEDEWCRQSKLVAQFLASMQQAAAAYSMGLIRHGSEAHRIEARAPLYAKPPAAWDRSASHLPEDKRSVPCSRRLLCFRGPL